MNLKQSQTRYFKTITLTPKELFIKQQFRGWNPLKQPRLTTFKQLNPHVDLLPFTIKVKLIKTVKTIIPSLQYYYIHPNHRFIKSYKYLNRLSANWTTQQAPTTAIQTLLKI